jgi:hypothetical protein
MTFPPFSLIAWVIDRKTPADAHNTAAEAKVSVVEDERALNDFPQSTGTYPNQSGHAAHVAVAMPGA